MKMVFTALIWLLSSQAVLLGNHTLEPIFNRNYTLYTKRASSAYHVISVPTYRTNNSDGKVSVYTGGKEVYSVPVKSIEGKLYLVTNNGQRVIEVYIGYGRPKIPSFLTVDPFGMYLNTKWSCYDAKQTMHTYELGNSLAYYLYSFMMHKEDFKALGQKLSVDDSCLYIRRNYTTYRLNAFTGKITDTREGISPEKMVIKRYKK
jgi:hypothetical protein